MRTTMVVAFVACVMSGCASSGAVWPSALPGIDARWEVEASSRGQRVTAVKLANAQVEYALYSSPDAVQYYSISDYRISCTKRIALCASRPGAPAYRDREVIAWLIPHQRNGLRFFERDGHGKWRELVPHTAEWDVELGMVLRLWSVHALIRNHGVAPASLTF